MNAYRFVDAGECNMCGSPDARYLGRRLNRSQGIRPTGKRGVSVSTMRCRGCGLVFADPQPVPLSLEQHYEMDPGEYWQAHDFQDAPAYFHGEIARFRSLWGEGSARALDLGAGRGKVMKALREAGFDVTGVEPSEQFREAAIAGGIDADRLRQATIETVELPADSFDLVTFSAVLEHLYDPAAALVRAREWVAENGLIHVEVPSSRWLTSRLGRLAYRAQGLDYSPYLSPMHPPYHLFEFALESFVRNGRRAGYEVVSHEVRAAPTYLPEPLAPLAERLMRRTGTGMQLMVWLRPT